MQDKRDPFKTEQKRRPPGKAAATDPREMQSQEHRQECLCHSSTPVEISGVRNILEGNYFKGAFMSDASRLSVNLKLRLPKEKRRLTVGRDIVSELRFER